MKCALCESDDARVVYVSRSYGAWDDLLVIENVPVISCPSCGERNMTAQTLHELEAIKADASIEGPECETRVDGLVET